ncbi:MAG: PEP-CTERM sorting domain-containing protein [Chthoniobacteraceae bacterium]
MSFVWNFVGGKGLDTLSLYVNGSLYETYTWTENSVTPSQLATLVLRQGGSTSAPVLTLDNISVLNPAELVVPEPSAGLLLMGGTMAIGLLRRPRRA